MREFVSSLIQVAAELQSDVVMVVEGNERGRNAIVSKVGELLGQIRRNEGLETFVHRRDSGDKTTLMVGLSEHPQKLAIMKALWVRAEKDAGRIGVRIWTKEMNGG